MSSFKKLSTLWQKIYNIPAYIIKTRQQTRGMGNIVSFLFFLSYRLNRMMCKVLYKYPKSKLGIKISLWLRDFQTFGKFWICLRFYAYLPVILSYAKHLWISPLSWRKNAWVVCSKDVTKFRFFFFVCVLWDSNWFLQSSWLYLRQKAQGAQIWA